MPTLLENNKLIINFNPSSVPENISFEKTLTTFEICSNDIVKFIRLLDPNKTHSWWNINSYVKIMYYFNM